MRSSILRSWTLASGCAAAVLAWSLAASAQTISSRPVERNDARDIACGVQALLVPPASTIRLVGGQERGKRLFGPGEAIVISGGSAQGISVGQEYVVRRVVTDRFTVPIAGFRPISIHTAGWVRIVEVDANVAIATITDACDGMLEGDYLEEFATPAAPSMAMPTGKPDYANPGRILLGDERRQLGSAGALMILDLGSNHDLRSGQRLTVFRYTAAGGTIFRVGEGTAVVVSPETSLVRIDTSRDAVYVGDLVAIHR